MIGPISVVLLSVHQSPTVGTIYINRSLGCRLQANDQAYIVAPIVDLLTSGRCSGQYCFANHWFACIGSMFGLLSIHQSTVYKSQADLEPIIYSPTFDFRYSRAHQLGRHLSTDLYFPNIKPITRQPSINRSLIL